MNAEQFRQMLPRSPVTATKLLGVSPEQIRKWSCGEEEIPAFAIALLQTVRSPAMGEYDVTGMAVIPPGYPGN